STNTAPNPIFAQPFRRMAHNGELNTDKKNRLSEDAIAKSKGKNIVFPEGQSDSSRLDQTLARRVTEDKMDIVEAIVAMMPPAWENDPNYRGQVRDMLAYYSLYEEKNDGPAALIFFDGQKIGARLDRLGLRPLRSIETHDYVAVMSEAGQIDFPPEVVLSRGRIEAGGMIVFDHGLGKVLNSQEILENLATKKDYSSLFKNAIIHLEELPKEEITAYKIPELLNMSSRHVAYSMNQESFKFFLDPMLSDSKEKVSAMGFGVAPNGLEPHEGGMSRYFSQRFAQVTNPPLDSIREADGMTLQVALGKKPNFSDGTTKQLILDTPILQPQQLLQIRAMKALKVVTVETLYDVDTQDFEQNERSIKLAVEAVCDQVEKEVKAGAEIVILSDLNIDYGKAAIPAILIVSAVNQRLISTGMRFLASLIAETGQAVSTHDTACLLGFGASAVCPITVLSRAVELAENEKEIYTQLKSYQKAIQKALMKTMGKFGLCTAESYIGGEFFESNFLDTKDPYLGAIFPNIHAPIGGASFKEIAKSAAEWHAKIPDIESEKDIPLLGLFKERAEGSGHSYGATAVREFVKMTLEDFTYTDQAVPNEAFDETELLPNDPSYAALGFEKRTPEQIDQHKITPAYRDFVKKVYAERKKRPATIRDVLTLPFNAEKATTVADYEHFFNYYNIAGNISISVQGMSVEQQGMHLILKASNSNYAAIAKALLNKFRSDVSIISLENQLVFKARGKAKSFFNLVTPDRNPIPLREVQAAHEITATFSSGAMSHGALVSRAHQAVAQGANISGALSNSGEGGEQSFRFNSIKASKIKQFASGRFGVWAGYVADPSLEEIEIKIAQGAKPGEGGQLPAKKVNVEIAAARSGTPGVELVSPPPHHDTYSIEDLAQLIHDAKCARVRVVVKLVSSEGIGTIAVGVAKAGADVINVAGNTGGTGAAQVTSLKNSGRAADIGIAEVHQALCENGIREKVILRCSNAHQTGMDVVKSAILGGDSFEFGTSALMMLKCVMAKNCNIKCPAGLTTNSELYEGDPRALAQYFINMAHEVREIIASLGYTSLKEIRGKTNLLNLINHKTMVGQMDMSGLLREVEVIKVEQPTYLEANFDPDDSYLSIFQEELIEESAPKIVINGPVLNNNNKTVGGQFSVDIERMLNYELTNTKIKEHPSIVELSNGRKVLKPESVVIKTTNSAGQSFGAFNNTGVTLIHTGTCNDGVGKALSGGCIVVKNPGFSSQYTSEQAERNVLVGNFALFGATGGELYVNGQAGDRFGVRNSGAVAVIEGVGDFCCEYMTNGSIVNLGSYGKGFGNGMSGGNAYQYDPSGLIAERCSQDSIEVHSITENTALADGHEVALLYHLKNHVARTTSPLASKILENWEEARKDFFYVIPKSLINYHRGENIVKLLSRKKMIEELAIATAKNHVRVITAAYGNMQPLFEGQLPNYGDQTDSMLFSQYMIVTGIWRRATEEAERAGARNIVHAARKIIVTQERKFMDALYKDMKEALVDYSDKALAHLVADKRVKDYKRAFSMREVADTNALGSTTWIMECDRVNQSHLRKYDAVEQQLATHYLSVLAHAMAELSRSNEKASVSIGQSQSSSTDVLTVSGDAFDGIAGERVSGDVPV
ncbi:MAG: glutamate synthase-related protein, partial [Bacteroidota bacterium]